MAALPEEITIGELAARAGVAQSALRYYEQRGLIRAERTGGNQRRYARAQLRRVAFIRAAQRVGMSLDEVEEALSGLPADRTPRRQDWSRLSRRMRSHLEGRIHELERLRDDLNGCVGCGCLSLRTCKLFNPDDREATTGSGPRILYRAMGDR
jgi:MerR family transcriptional regulator, redox-sensitive transcriptional activator SoxR